MHRDRERFQRPAGMPARRAAHARALAQTDRVGSAAFLALDVPNIQDGPETNVFLAVRAFR